MAFKGTQFDADGRLQDPSRRRVALIVAVVILFVEIVPLQFTMMFAAVPQIAPSFPDAGSNISWILIVFLLVGAATTPIIGKMSDMWGKRLILLAVGAAFFLGNLICALTESWPVFLAGRGVAALGYATPVLAYGLFRDILPRRYIPVAVGSVAGGFGFAAVAAPLLGGWILDRHDWRWLFWSMLIFVAAVGPLLRLVVPESRFRLRQRLDLAGAAFLAGGVGLVLLYLANGAAWGWASASSLACLLSSLALLAVFAVTERLVPEPVMDLRLLFTPRVSLVLLNSLVTTTAIGILTYSIPFMMQSPTSEQITARVIGRLAEESSPPLSPAELDQIQVGFVGDIGFALGLTLLGFATHAAVFGSGTFSIVGILAGAWSRKVGPRRPLIVATAALIASSLLYASFNQFWWQYAIISVVQGIGLGAFYSSVPNLLVEAVPAAQQGISAGMYGVTNAIGLSLGTAIVTSAQSANPLKFFVQAPGQPRSPLQNLPQLYTAWAYEFTFYVAAIAATGGLIIAVLMRHGRAPASGGAAVR